MPKRVIVLFPEFGNVELIRQFHRRFDPLASQIPPHLTLVFPFESTLSPAELQAHVEGAVRGVAPFEVVLRGITGHEGEYLFLNVKRGNDAVIDLHDRLYTGPLRPHLLTEWTFVPHLTVGRVPERSAFLQALSEAAALDATFRTLISEVTVYRVEPDGHRAIESVTRLRPAGR